MAHDRQTHDWQTSFLNVPENIRVQVEQLAHDEFVIYAILQLKFTALAQGDFAHLQVRLSSDRQVVMPEHVMPELGSGLWAQRNQRDGYTKTFRDRPKITKTWSTETPNFGDWSNGSHEINWSREVYQKETIPPPGWGIRLSLLRATDDEASIGFELDQVFDRSRLNEIVFFFALNVFQEAVGLTNVRESSTPMVDFLQTLLVDWEILPPGDADEIMRVVEERLRPGADERRVIEERLRFLIGLHPEHLITGRSGFARYVGAQFAPDLVVFENVRYGNAAYVMFDDWQRLSQLSRLELIASHDNFIRVVHAQGWERKLRDIVRDQVRRRRRR